jgi:hypothetical protein
MAIDFTSIYRGRRAARQDIQAERLSAQREEEFAFQRQQREQQALSQSYDRDATAYTATLLGNMQQAANAGQSDLDYMIEQRNVVLQDPNFQAFSPEVQQRVLARLGSAAQVTAQQYVDAGELSAARRLYDAWGWGNQISDKRIAASSGNIGSILATYDPKGELYKANPDGTVTILATGVNVPQDRFAAAIAAGGAGAVPVISAGVSVENTQREQIDTANAAALAAARQQQENDLLLRGFTRQPGGFFQGPNPNDPTTVLRVQLPTVPGQEPIISIAPAPPVAAPAATAAAATPGAAATPAARIAELQSQLPALQTAYDTLAAEEANLKNWLAANATPAPLSAIDVRYGIAPRLVPVNGADPLVLEQTQKRLQELRTQVPEALVQLKVVRDQALPSASAAAQVQTIGAGAPAAAAVPRQPIVAPSTWLQQAIKPPFNPAAGAAWAAEAMKPALAAGATLERAEARNRESPRMVDAYINGLEGRMRALAAVPGSEAEIVELLAARNNLIAAKAKGVPR